MEKQESWKPVVGYEGLYECSDMGRVKSLPRFGTKGGILKPRTDKWGYLQVRLCKNGKKEPCKVHQLVMESFIGKCPDGYEVDHYDWNPRNNKLSNLRYLPAEENNSRKSPEWQKNVREGAKKRAKPIDQFTLDGEFVKRWSSASDAANELGINNGNISSCCKGRYKSAGGFIWRFAD